MITREYLGDAGGHEKINPTSATAITASVRQPTSGRFKGMMAKNAYVTVETQIVRFREDGTSPEAAAGHVINATGNYVVRGPVNVKNIEFIDTAAGASTVFVTCYF